MGIVMVLSESEDEYGENDDRDSIDGYERLRDSECDCGDII